MEVIKDIKQNIVDKSSMGRSATTTPSDATFSSGSAYGQDDALTLVG